MGSGLVKVLVRNAASNWLGFAVQAGVAFFLTPFVLASLGPSRYGVWMLIGSLTGYYGLLDLGFRAGLTQYLTRFLATRDYESLNRTASTGLAALACCGSLIFLAALALTGLAPVVFQIPDEFASEVRWAILINGSAVAMQLCLFPFSAVFTATQRYDISNGIGISTRLLGALGTYLALHLGYGLVGLSVVTAGANLLDYALRWRLAYWILPQLRVSFRAAGMAYCWPLLGFGVWNVLTLVSIQLSAYSSEVLIAAFLGAAAIAPYALAISLINYYTNLFVPIGTAFFPAATQMDAQGRHGDLRRVYLHGSRMLLLFAGGAALISGFFAPTFFELWIGERLGPESGPAPALLFRILVLGAACTATQRIGYQVLMGCRRIRALALLLAAEAITALAIVAGVLPFFGLVGMAIAMAACTAAFQAFVQPWANGKLLGITCIQYVRSVWLRPCLVFVVLAGLLVVLDQAWSAHSWLELLTQGAIAGGAGAALIWFVGIDAATRKRLREAVLPRSGRHGRSPLTPMVDPFDQPREELIAQPTARVVC